MDSEVAADCNPPLDPEGEEKERLLDDDEVEAPQNVEVNEEGSSGEEEEVDELLAIREGKGNIQHEHPLTDYSVDKEVCEKKIAPDPRRWIVLATLWATMVYMNLAWVTFSPVADIVACYYGVSIVWINILSWITMAVYVVGFLPSTWFLNRFGLKVTGVLAGGLVGIAGWLRFAGAGADYYWFLLGGNLAVAVQNVLIWNSVSQVSGMWFPPNERALSTAVVGSLGAQVGILVGAVLSPVVVTSDGYVEVCNDNVSRSSQAFIDWQAQLYPRLLYYLLAQAIFATVVFLATFPMPTAPKMPPSISRTLKTSMTKPSFFRSYFSVVKNPYLVFCFLVFGIFIGSGGAFMTVYDEILVHSGYIDDQKYASLLGMAMQIFASIAVLTVSRWIDLTKSYYLTTVTIAAACTLVVGTFAILVHLSCPFWLICIPVTLTRGLVIAFQPVGFEYGAEITYPVPENISNGITNGFNQAWSMSLIIVGGLLVDYEMPLFCILMFTGIFLLGTIGLLFIRPELKRLKLDLKEDDIWKTCCHINFYRQRAR